MFYQVILPPQVRQSVIINFEHDIKELPHELSNDLGLRMLKN